jgi:hypothetical protein
MRRILTINERERIRRKAFVPNSRYQPGIFLGSMKKKRKFSAGMAGVKVEI